MGRSCTTGPGYPIDTTSYSQPSASFLTLDTIWRAVKVGPESISRLSFSPEARTLTWVPHTSMTSIFIGGPLSRLDLACLLEHFGFGRDNTHQFVPGFDKRLGALVLQCRCQRVDIDAGLRKLRQYRFGV